MFGLTRKTRPPMAWCDGCESEWSEQAMNWTDIGLYRCRRCNPDPGPPNSNVQTPEQYARSRRYAEAAQRDSRRCTECGRRLRKNVWHNNSWLPDAENVPDGVGLCDDCVGPQPFEHGWMGFRYVGY